MKLNDAVWGALLLLFSATLLVHIQAFPRMPGQPVGPALFPGIIAVGFAICGALLVIKGLGAPAAGDERASWLEFEPWTRSRRHVLAFALVVGVNVFYILFVDRIGFIVVGVVYLALLFGVFRVSIRWILPIALLVTLGIHYAFYKLLKVPLPWGWLAGIAW
jgi:putative tricarboxylic transport membrane protein